MRIKPTELRLVADLLQEPADNADDLARTIIEGLDTKRATDPMYVVAVHDPGVGWFAYGPYTTHNQAHKAIGRRIVSASLGARGTVLKVIKEEK